MRTDPSDTGGMFIGRRPGTKPATQRPPAPYGAPGARRDRLVARVLLLCELLVLGSIWGPQPIFWLWVGSQADYRTGSVEVGLACAFLGMLLTLMTTLSLAAQIDRIWILARRAGGIDQEKGVLEILFATSVLIGGLGFVFWLFVIEGPGSSLIPARGA